MNSQGWTTPEDIRGRLRREWDKGRILSAPIVGEPVFPWRIPLRRPTSAELSARFPEVQKWIAGLVASAKAEEEDRGYTLEWREIQHRQLGRNRIPVAAMVATEQDGLAIIGKRREAVRFRQLASDLLDRFPVLTPWVVKRPHTVLEKAEFWPRFLAVLDWVSLHPRPGVYLRQLDLPGVDTKFIESHRGILSDLLDLVLPPDAVDRRFSGQGGFERRYGFKPKPAQIRFRLLDPRLYIKGLSDLTVTSGEFAQLDLPVRRIFITENEINSLAFPQQADSLVLFGSGYGFEALTQAAWLADKEIFYWGDIDTHGFAILDQLRSHFPAAHSLLMDRKTLLAHQALWGREERPTARALERLRPEETELYDDLRYDRLAPSLRLEQERLGFAWVEATLAAIRLHPAQS